MEHDASEPTVEAGCARCAARARIDAACVRSGVERITIVIKFVRVPVGPYAVQQVAALMSSADGSIVRGDGACHEEAIADALARRGVSLDARRPYR